ncbi:MAG: LuxR family transcriptional regulator [Rhizobiaceae bacterium]|nr:LuxR family transcriptional regulator [Rhizobiaceae bacterium]
MSSAAVPIDPSASRARRLATRADLTGYLTALCQALGADSYMLVAILHDQRRSDVRIVASNWIYDATLLVGHHRIAMLAESAQAAALGFRPEPLVTRAAPAGLGGEDARILDILGHSEIYALRLNVGRQRYFLLLSSEEPGILDPHDVMRAQMRCCYALGQVPELLAATAQQDPLSDRERECLYWVSEGKTSDEIALILGVSGNTVNTYVNHAIQKFSASNRAEAVATAIRNGII